MKYHLKLWGTGEEEKNIYSSPNYCVKTFRVSFWLCNVLFRCALQQECKRIEEEREAIQSQFEGVQKENQQLKERNLEMKKEQRKILDELEIQLSSLIKEKKKLEEE